MKRLHLNKKGEAEEMETLTLFDIIIGIAVAVLLILAVFSYSGLSGLGKLYVENDLSMMVSALMSSPGDIIAKYPLSPNYKVSGICSADTEECKRIKVLSSDDSPIWGGFQKDNIVFRANPEAGLYDIKRVLHD
ncbi:MAG: hypothetical protein PHO02_02105 [Candidatus Nanoarchaeia archaeon]|nr:hypothetical protein [Candidatus Nanoarchaeia archaeon]